MVNAMCGWKSLRRGRLVAAAGFLFLGPALVLAEPNSDTLGARLDAALEERIDIAGRLELLDELARHVPLAERASSSAWTKGEIIRAVVDFRLNHLSSSQKRLEALCSSTSSALDSELFYRCRSALGAVLMFNQEIDASLEVYEALVRQDSKGLPSNLVRRAKVNHAAVLYEHGRSAEAVEIYEAVLVDAATRGDERTALHAGHNLVHVLIKLGDYEGAHQVLDRLEESRRAFPLAVGPALLELRRLELEHLEGDSHAAMVGLRDFLARHPSSGALVEGSARRLLAEALLARGKLGPALSEAKRAQSLLIRRANKATEARLSVAAVLIASQAYEAALEELNAIDVDRERVPSRRTKAQLLRLQAILGREGRSELVPALASLLASHRAHLAEGTVARGRFLEARLRAAEFEAALQRVEADAEAEQSRLRHRVQLALAIVLATLGLLFVYRRRRITVERLEAQALRSQKLEAEVEARTRELMETVKQREQMEQALQRKRRVEAVGMLAGNVAHDFNNLLQVIATANEQLAGRDDDDDETLRLSNQSIEHGSRIVRQLLAYARKQPLSTELIRVDLFLEQSKSLLESAVGGQVRLVWLGELPRVSVRVDPSLLTTALLNLLRNASDAMPEGGEIRVAVTQDELTGQSPWDSLEFGTYVSFSIEDSGTGMTEEEVERALEPFFSTKDEIHGTGLGLSSVYGFIRQSGGDLRLQSRRGKGTKVEFVLPRHHSLPSSRTRGPRKEEVPTAVSLPGERVLLVEDDGAVAIAIRTLLKRLGKTVDIASCADEACRLLNTSTAYEFVLSDCRMPGAMDGVGLADWCRDNVPDLDVFLMSGFYGHDRTYDRPLLPKPFSGDQLEAFLREHRAIRDGALANPESEPEDVPMRS